MHNVNHEAPSILIYCSNKLDDIKKLDEILWGIEEEGIPYKLKCIDEDNYEKLSHLASIDSKLGVGIGIASDEIISLTYNKLSQGEYIYKINLNQSEDDLRRLGANSARLVKNIPFK